VCKIASKCPQATSDLILGPKAKVIKTGRSFKLQEILEIPREMQYCVKIASCMKQLSEKFQILPPNCPENTRNKNYQMVIFAAKCF